MDIGHTRAKGGGMESVKSQIVIISIKRGLQSTVHIRLAQK